MSSESGGTRTPTIPELTFATKWPESSRQPHMDKKRIQLPLLSARFQIDLAVMVGARQQLSHRPTGSDESPFRAIRIHQPGLPVRLDVWDVIRNLEPWYPLIHI